MTLEEENKALREALAYVLTSNIVAYRRAEGWVLQEAGCGCCGGDLPEDEIQHPACQTAITILHTVPLTK